ncbi:uncharacterized protein LOC124944968 [Impatiens glandulifera]|uniref:uncharacterized protein LOC124944968 n=1 Tax=Impatiens glandulifera TaxID=253017 RepID=UPI001FB0AC7C|nr:uncharacterized protein LOC124944968 [Impatiens glandulifera]
MTTRTNFYKNPSRAYNKAFNLNSALQNLKAYNDATGNAPVTGDATENGNVEKEVNRKRPRERKPQSRTERNDNVIEDDHPMSHQEYVDKIRKELNCSLKREELNVDVLTNSRQGLALVQYESDQSSSPECDEKAGPSRFDVVPSSGNVNKDEVKRRSEEQRFAVPGEPVCVICGKYGEYICDETDDDICSMDCKAEVLGNLKLSQGCLNNQKPCESSSSSIDDFSRVIELGGDMWDHERFRWSRKRSSLCTYECWKCQKPSHLAEDCLAVTTGERRATPIPRSLLDLYKRCHQIGKSVSGTKCNSCNLSSSLATCLGCNVTFCDSAGHLREHIRVNPSHGEYYSFKLKRLVKCCKSSCKVTDIKTLLACHFCFDKAFEKFYDMYTATWNGAALSIIWGSICCEGHFEWHRMNCLNAGIEDNSYIINKAATVQVSDFIF